MSSQEDLEYFLSVAQDPNAPVAMRMEAAKIVETISAVSRRVNAPTGHGKGYVDLPQTEEELFNSPFVQASVQSHLAQQPPRAPTGETPEDDFSNRLMDVLPQVMGDYQKDMYEKPYLGPDAGGVIRKPTVGENYARATDQDMDWPAVAKGAGQLAIDMVNVPGMMTSASKNLWNRSGPAFLNAIGNSQRQGDIDAMLAAAPEVATDLVSMMPIGVSGTLDAALTKPLTRFQSPQMLRYLLDRYR